MRLFPDDMTHLLSGGAKALLLAVVMSVALTGCFTGVESTPKITYKDVRREKVTVSPEQQLSDTLRLAPFSKWAPGKRFFVTTPKVALALRYPAGGEVKLERGDLLTFMGAHTVNSLTGKKLVELSLQTPDGRTVLYNTNATESELSERERLEIPFMVDVDFVDRVASELLGKKFFIKTALWYSDKGEVVGGRKFVEVEIFGVQPANETYPVMLLFNDMTGHTGCVYMSATNSGSGASRRFDALFSLDDPRKRYPRITDENWKLIQQSKVAKGMTRDEASLALGSPANIDRGRDYSFAYERWTYPDGIYLIFEDGILVRYNR